MTQETFSTSHNNKDEEGPLKFNVPTTNPVSPVRLEGFPSTGSRQMPSYQSSGGAATAAAFRELSVRQADEERIREEQAPIDSNDPYYDALRPKWG